MNQRTLLFAGLAVSAAIPLSGSCIIPDTVDIIDPNCGTKWATTAVGAQGVNGSGQRIQVLYDNNFVVGYKCLSGVDAQEMEDGLDLDCHAILTENLCTGDCEWVEDALGSGQDVCVPDDPDFQVHWEDIVQNTAGDCNIHAAGLTMDPDCAQHSGTGKTAQDACEDAGCDHDWASGACTWPGPNCFEAAFAESVTADGLFDDGSCALPNDACLEAQTGGGDGSTTTTTSGGSGADTTGAPAHPWGDDFANQITCDNGVCDVDQQLVDDIIANPTPGLDDSARFELGLDLCLSPVA